MESRRDAPHPVPASHRPSPPGAVPVSERGAPRVGFVSLGCPKATVDSEQIITQLRAEGYQIVPQYDQADLVIINTCGFILDAKEESVDTILVSTVMYVISIGLLQLFVTQDLRMRLPAWLSAAWRHDSEWTTWPFDVSA